MKSYCSCEGLKQSKFSFYYSSDIDKQKGGKEQKRN